MRVKIIEKQDSGKHAITPTSATNINNFDNNLISSGELSYGRLGNSMYMDDFSTDYQVKGTKNFNQATNGTGGRAGIISDVNSVEDVIS